MTVRGASASLLALLFVVAIWAPALAESHESPGGFEAAFKFSSAGQLISEGDAGGSPVDADRQWMALVEKELDAAKQELLELEGVRQAALVLYSDPGEVCEREVIERWYHEERARLKSNVSALRSFRGDRRGVFTKVWHKIGPLGRRIVRAIGDEALVTLKSGGTLGGGVARRILIRVGRKQLKNVVLAGIARKIEARAAAAKGAAEEECKTDGPEATPGAEAGATDAPPAIPAGTYIGAFDEAELKQTGWVDDPTIEVNTFELVIAEDGAISGDWEIHQSGEMSSASGMATGCAGAAGIAVASVDTGQLIGPVLPQAVSTTAALTLVDTIAYYSVPDEPVISECTDPEPYDLGTEAFELVLRSYAGGTISGEFPDWVTFELERLP